MDKPEVAFTNTQVQGAYTCVKDAFEAVLPVLSRRAETVQLRGGRTRKKPRKPRKTQKKTKSPERYMGVTLARYRMPRGGRGWGMVFLVVSRHADSDFDIRITWQGPQMMQW